MKKVMTFFLALGLVFYLSSTAVFAQSRGSSHGPSVTGGHGPDINHSTDQGKSADHANTTHSQTQGSKNTDFMTRINSNTQLKDRLTALLPQLPQGSTTTMDLTTAANGFKNQGQFIAFLHVAKNHNLTLDQWTKMHDMMASGESLGKALQAAKPELTETQVTVSVQQAEAQTSEDLKIKPKKIS